MSSECKKWFSFAPKSKRQISSRRLVRIGVLIALQSGSHRCDRMNATCVWGEPQSVIVNPFACYICEPLTLNANDTLHIWSDIEATEIVSVNFWMPWSARFRWDIDHIPRELFKTFQNLRALVLPAHIQSISSDDFSDAANLEHLELMNNNIKSIPAMVFIHSPKLRRLNLSWNRIQQIGAEAFSGLKYLRYLHLDRNRLASLDQSVFRGIDDLTVLTISKNRLERIDDDVLDFPNLIEIDLSNNKLRTLSNMTFNRCIKLQKVQLKSNALQSIGQALYRLRDLHYINLDRNHIDDAHIESFARLKHLEYLSLQYNGRQSFDALLDADNVNAQMKNRPESSIQELYLAGNGLKNPHFLRHLRCIGLTQLEKLDLDSNAFERLDFDEIPNFPRLRQINLGQNRWNCDWLNDTVQRFENENIAINLYSSHFPTTVNETHINYIPCVWRIQRVPGRRRRVHDSHYFHCWIIIISNNRAAIYIQISVFRDSLASCGRRESFIFLIKNVQQTCKPYNQLTIRSGDFFPPTVSHLIHVQRPFSYESTLRQKHTSNWNVVTE